MNNIKIEWIGCHSEGIKAFRTILELGHTVSRFITLDDEAFAKRSSASREYLDMCKSRNIPISEVSTIKDDVAYELIKKDEPDLLVVMGWNEILPQNILEIPKVGTVGTHASMLPHNRGSAPVNWEIINGEKTGGNSLMWLNKNVDQGDIIDQISFEITDFDTCRTVYEKVADTNSVMLKRLVNKIQNKEPINIVVNNISDEPILPRRHPDDGKLDWNQTNKKVYDFIRALTEPYPGAFSYYDKKKVFIWKASLLADQKKNTFPGKIIGNVYSSEQPCCGIQVSCSEGSIIVHEIQFVDGDKLLGPQLCNLNLKGKFEGSVECENE